MSAPARPRGVRNRKRTPARPTAHIGYQPAGLDRWGHRVKATYHAITDQALKIGSIIRNPAPLCVDRPGPGHPCPMGCSRRW